MPITLDALRRRPAANIGLSVALVTALFAALGPIWSGAAQAVDESTSKPAQDSTSKDSKSDELRYRVANTDGEGLRVRKEPGLEGSIVARLPEGALVSMRDEKPVEKDGERWVAVKMTEGKGWLASRYAVKVSGTAPAKLNLPADAPFADRVVAIARSAHGQPYAWAGNAPGGFDCSGFVQWVYTQAGVKLERLIPDQLEQGKKVERAELKPGDLVAFVNTYKSGVSHVGIYLGSNLFQHASDDAHGVTVSSLVDPYWEERFHRAVRLK